LREYDLKSHSVVLPFADRAISVDQVMENQGKMQQTLESQAQIIGILKTERDELEYKLDSWSKEFQEGAKK
jgi:hypothetical protein